MTQAPITYDLVVLLDPQSDGSARERTLAECKAAIEGHGELLRQDNWGPRALAYPINHKTDAEYHLFQFHVSDNSVLAQMDRSLHLADEVLRFMISKLAPGTPEAPQNPDTRAARHGSAEHEPAAAA